MHELAIELLKRALELSWYVNNESLEMTIYDALGLSYYYSGYVQSAIIFHEKYMTGY